MGGAKGSGSGRNHRAKRVQARSAGAGAPKPPAAKPPGPSPQARQPATRKPAAAAPPAADSLYERYKDALRRGHVAALRGRLDLAIDAYGEAASIARDRALPHAAIGGILVRMDRLPDALASFDRALELAPGDETALRGRADALAALGRRVDAADTLDRLAEVLLDGGRLPDASDAARRALELAESRERRRSIEDLAVRLRESAGDEAAERALAGVLRVLEPPVAPVAPPEAIVDQVGQPDGAAQQEPEPEPEPEPELPDGVLLGMEAEEALSAGHTDEAREGLLNAARSHRRVGRSFAAIDSLYLALAIAPADVDLHLLLAELYLERGWRGPAIDKLLLLARLADLAEDDAVRQRLCALAREQLSGEPRLAELCA
jgi:tetratricopeptide (TPR) repeat protein